MSRRPTWLGRLGRCPIESNGEVVVWRTRSGRLVAMCDECDAVWFDPAAIVETPGEQTWSWDLEGDDGLDRPATRAEVEAGGWAGYLASG